VLHQLGIPRDIYRGRTQIQSQSYHLLRCCSQY